MKRHFAMLAFFFLTMAAYGQDTSRMVRITAHALYKPDERIFYKGVSNPFSVSISGVAPDNLMVMTTLGVLQRREGEYDITFPGDTTTKEKSARLYFATRDSAGNTIMLDSARFSVRAIPFPEALVAGRPGGKISKDAVLAADSIVIILRNCHLKKKCSIVSFNLNYYKDLFFYEFKQPSGNKFTEQQKSAILHMDGEGIFNLDKIRVLCPDGVIRTIAPLKIVLTN